VEALKASVRGVIAASAALPALQERVEASGEGGPVDAALLGEMARCAAAIAVGAGALRGLAESLVARRE